MFAVRGNGFAAMLMALATVGSMTWSAEAAVCEQQGDRDSTCSGLLHQCVQANGGCYNCTYTEEKGCQ
eukprot:2314259-Pyramimonas_sp.AAC.1